MDAMAQAFERVGLPSFHVRFASACYDLARLALNREPDPKRAVARWHGIAHMPQFEEELISAFIAFAYAFMLGSHHHDET